MLRMHQIIPLHYPCRLRRLLCFHSEVYTIYGKSGIIRYQCRVCDQVSKYREKFEFA